MSSTSGGSRGGSRGRGGFGVFGSFGDSAAQELVAAAIRDFERRSSLRLSQRAKQLVLNPAIEHSSKIQQELNLGAVQPSQIQDAIQTLLSNAERIATERNLSRIDESVVKVAMKLDCRYFPWC